MVVIIYLHSYIFQVFLLNNNNLHTVVWLPVFPAIILLQITTINNNLSKNCSFKKRFLICILYEGHGLLTWWWHWFLWDCHWSLVRRYIGIISIHNLLKLCSANVNRSNERKWFHTKRARGKRYPAKTIIATDYKDNQGLFFTNISAQIKFLPHSLKRVLKSICFYMNSDKTGFMYINQDGTIFSLYEKLLKSIDQLIYLSSNISSTECYVSIRISKSWTAIDRLWTIWKSELSDKIKLEFFQVVAMSVLLHGSTTWTLTKRA